MKWLSGPEPRPTRFGEKPNYREGLWQLSEHCFAWMVPNGSWGETNIGIIKCGGQSVLIDTCWTPHHTREMLDGAKDLFVDAPIEHIVNTHADGDHWWGNQLFPGRQIIASNACVKQMHHLKPQVLTTIKRCSHAWKHLPLLSINHLGRYAGGMFQPYDFSEIKLTPPGEGFSGEHTLTAGGIDLVMTEIGPAHTEGDIFVYLPSERIVYAADILFIGGTPVAWAGPVDNIIAALQRLLVLDVDLYVPGHGALAQRPQVQLVLDYWEFARDMLSPPFERGTPPAAAACEILLSDDFQNRPFAHWNCPERLVTNAFTLYRHWSKRKSALPAKVEALNILRNQGRVAEEIRGCFA